MNIYRRKGESQDSIKGSVLRIKGFLWFFFLSLTTYYLILNTTPAYAIVDPLASPNNKFGIHIISPTHDEITPAVDLVNSSGGDWGYITVLIQSKDRDKSKWQTFFNELRRRHLIPLVRIATAPSGNYWKIPQEGEEEQWANFLDSLNWPTKNRYIIIYNEPNQGQEWEGKADAKSYARVLDRTINALKNKNSDFFVINAGFDASAPNKPPLFEDEATFLREMNDEVPGIFNKLDGWSSHSYPNPGFAGSPNASGRGTVRTWEWELFFLAQLGARKTFPVFITETGWKHSEGLDYDKSLPSSETVGLYFKDAFENAWNNDRIVAVTPFLLDYQDSPFDHFSFKRPTGKTENLKILGATSSKFYPQYQVIAEMPKSVGRPMQDSSAKLISGEIYKTMVSGESYIIPLTFENTGQSIWNDQEKIELRGMGDGKEFSILPVSLPAGSKIEPGQKVTLSVDIKALGSGDSKVDLQFFRNNQSFNQNSLNFPVTIKSPVIIQIKSVLPWKKSWSGKYVLSIASNVMKSTLPVSLDNKGNSSPIETRYLLPDYSFDFTLHKPFYKPKTISYQVKSGVNELNFGTLEPDFFAALLKPQEFWKLLPFSN